MQSSSRSYLARSFFDDFDDLCRTRDNDNWTYTDREIEAAIFRANHSLGDLPVLLAVERTEHLEALVAAASAITARRFGRVIGLYAPLYVSSHCTNECRYCGFRHSAASGRILLTPEEIKREADCLKAKGIEQVLVVSGEDARYAGMPYLREVLGILGADFHYISFEVQPLSFDEYRSLYEHGLDGVTIYQETYDRELYADYHRAGAKRDYRYRLEAPERVALAEIPNAGLGALLGLAPYRREMYALAHHLAYCITKYWKTQFAISFPRIRPENTGFSVPHPVSDFAFVTVLAAMRLVFPDTPIYLSTRETPDLRDSLSRICITHMSAGSRTEPGGYASATGSTRQFDIEDDRSVESVIAMLRKNHIQPVAKDWDRGYRIASSTGGIQ